VRKKSGAGFALSRLLLIAIAIGAALAPAPAALVERYSSALVPVLQRGMTSLSNLTAIAFIDVAIGAGVAWLVLQTLSLMIAGPRHGWLRPTLRWLGRISVAASVLYLAFLAMWGLNYRRSALTERVPYDPRAVSADAASSLALRAVGEVNRLYATGRSGDSTAASIDDSLAHAFAQAQRAIGVRKPALPARPKRSILDAYFKAAGVEGMTDPFFLETLVAGDLLPFERPFVIAHEWSHLAGLADEGEANFLGWLTCTKGTDDEQYSGWLFLYGQVLASLNEADRKQVDQRLDPGPRADLQAAAARARRNLNPFIADAGWRVYDRYLRANRIEAGTASYAEVVRLVLGVRLEPS
jgi:hypothetical protein